MICVHWIKTNKTKKHTYDNHKLIVTRNAHMKMKYKTGTLSPNQLTLWIKKLKKSKERIRNYVVCWIIIE